MHPPRAAASGFSQKSECGSASASHQHTLVAPSRAGTGSATSSPQASVSLVPAPRTAGRRSDGDPGVDLGQVETERAVGSGTDKADGPQLRLADLALDLGLRLMTGRAFMNRGACRRLRVPHEAHAITVSSSRLRSSAHPSGQVPPGKTRLISPVPTVSRPGCRSRRSRCCLPTLYSWTMRSPVCGDPMLSLAALSIPAGSPFSVISRDPGAEVFCALPRERALP